MAKKNKGTSYYMLEWQYMSTTNKWVFYYFLDEIVRCYNEPKIQNYGRSIVLHLPTIDIKPEDNLDTVINHWKNKMVEQVIEDLGKRKASIDQEIETFLKLIK